MGSFGVVAGLPFFFSVTVSKLLCSSFLAFRVCLRVRESELRATSLVSVAPGKCWVGKVKVKVRCGRVRPL